MNQHETNLLRKFLFGDRDQGNLLSDNLRGRGDHRAMADLRKAVAETEAMCARELPSLSKEHVQRMADLAFGITWIAGDFGEELCNKLSGAVLKELVAAKVDWAVAITKAKTYDQALPAYRKAIKAGVDPAPFLQASLQIPAEDARKAVEEIRKAEAEGNLPQ